jgi:hypothetical protein
MDFALRKSCFQIAKSLQKGDVLFCKKFKFPGGSQKDKYLLILSNCISSKFYIFVLLTSQTGFYKNQYNRIDTIWLHGNKIKLFPLDTVIDLKKFFYWRASQIGEKIYDGTLKRAGKIPDDLIIHIDSVVEKAKTLNPKIKSLILGKQI